MFHPPTSRPEHRQSHRLDPRHRPDVHPAGVVNAIADHDVTGALLVPTMIQMLVDSPEAKAADLSSMEAVIYGASVISESVLGKARAMFPNARFTQAYGMTELAPIATVLTEEDHKNPALARSCGRPASHCELKIVDPDDVEVPRGEVGEVVARGDHMMAGYWNKPKETEDALRGGWMHTGDAAYMDSEGYVFIVDRIKDMIVTGGENVYTAEVENAVIKHPAVAQVAVIGVPDEEWGERVHAVVVRAPDQEVTAEELRDFCREHIGGYKLPRASSSSTPSRLGAGKILKREPAKPTGQSPGPCTDLTQPNKGRVCRDSPGIRGLIPCRTACYDAVCAAVATLTAP
jgi:acyl-CoA synthetase (AMP-forming)/AMP-acid ligase II